MRMTASARSTERGETTLVTSYPTGAKCTRSLIEAPLTRRRSTFRTLRVFHRFCRFALLSRMLLKVCQLNLRAATRKRRGEPDDRQRRERPSHNLRGGNQGGMGGGPCSGGGHHGKGRPLAA